MNYICCNSDIKVSKISTKSGAQLELQGHIINDFRVFTREKATTRQATMRKTLAQHIAASLNHDASKNQEDNEDDVLFESVPYRNFSSSHFSGHFTNHSSILSAVFMSLFARAVFFRISVPNPL
jgi:hypothetical protein